MRTYAPRIAALSDASSALRLRDHEEMHTAQHRPRDKPQRQHAEPRPPAEHEVPTCNQSMQVTLARRVRVNVLS